MQARIDTWGAGAMQTVVARAPVPRVLAPFVRGWSGYDERTSGLCRRREVPGPAVAVIFELGAPLRVSESGGEACVVGERGGFVAGLDDSFSITEHDGHQAGIEVKLTPLGARAYFDVPLHELARTVTPLDSVAPDRLVLARLSSAESWSERFTIVARSLRERLLSSTVPIDGGARFVAWAAARIEDRGGNVAIGDLAAAAGHSRKTLSALFAEHVGIGAKRYADVVRFDRVAQRLVPGASPPSWARLADELGYADQAHLARSVRRFTGLTPTALWVERSGETFLQEAPAP
jgi:AraC-like DNA-binding protein